MAATSSANLPNLLVNTYTRPDYIVPHERAMAVFYSETDDFPDGGKPIGKGRTWGVRTKDSHAAGGTAEGSDLPAFTQPAILQLTVTAIQIAASVAWTELMLMVGSGEGVITAEDVIDDHVQMTTRNIMSALNRLTLGHGTGRMAVVETTTSSSTTFVCRNPEGILQLRENMTIDFFDTDTGGTKQGATETIVSINPRTRTVTIGNARSLTATWGVYKALSSTVSEYGVAPMGLRGWNDNATLAATVGTQARSSNPQLNAQVFTANGGTQSYSEKLVRTGINSVWFATGAQVEEIWTNQGIVSQHLNHLTGQRVFTVSPGENVPRYRIGHDEKDLCFHHNGRDIPFRVDSDLPAREMHLIVKSLYQRHVLRKPNWVGDGIGPDGSVSPVLLQAPGTAANTYALQKVAGMLAALNYGHKMPKAGCAIKEIFDEELAGDV